MKRVLTIAGSDSGGGAGIQADLKTITLLGVYGMSAPTALTAQNTIGVQAIQEVPATFVEMQIDSVLSDIGHTCKGVVVYLDSTNLPNIPYRLCPCSRSMSENKTAFVFKRIFL